ncbi:MAG: hypothetical protein Q7V57_16330 [Actinomycetota bacterium]|nr:hypothetical protein [Actinomycetota bacterium]
MITRAAILAVAALLTAGWSRIPTATADSEEWLTAPDGLPLFDLATIAPGDSGAATLVVTNPLAFPVTVEFSVASLRDDDNGCTEPERVIGDTTCGSGGGELQDDLRITLTDATTGAVFAADTVHALAALTVPDPVALSGYQARTYAVGYELPIWSSNMTQSDLVAFELVLVLQPVGGSAVESQALPATAPLPATGSDHRVFVVLALALVAAGLGFRWVSGSGRLTRSSGSARHGHAV